MSSTLRGKVAKLIQACGYDIRRSEDFQWLKPYSIHTVLDIGANIGQFATRIHRALPDAMLYSFEPLNECYEKLTSVFQNPSHFRAFNYALGDADGEADIHRSSYTPSSSFLAMENLHREAFPFTERSRLEKVTVRRLDSIADDLELRDSILLKIDVQGFEDRVIAGGRKTVSRAKVLIVETSFKSLYEGQPLFADIYDIVRGMGFSFMGSLNLMKNPLTGDFLQSDSVFVRTSK